MHWCISALVALVLWCTDALVYGCTALVALVHWCTALAALVHCTSSSGALVQCTTNALMHQYT